MISRWAKKEEKHDLQVMWSRVFGDGPDVTEVFFRHFPPERHTRVIPAEYGIKSMASWMPVTISTKWKEYSGAYIYAVATAPECRGEGLGSIMVTETSQVLADAGLDFACLCPASNMLYDFYAAFGYEKAFYCHRFRAEAGDWAIPLKQIDSTVYRDERRRYLTVPFCDWEAGAISFLSETGMRFYRFPGGCAAVSLLPDGSAVISELISANPPVAAAGLCRALGTQGADVFAPGTQQPRGMLKWFTLGQKIPPAHLGFAFD